MEQRNYKLYVHIAPNGKKYYGITCEEKVERRWRNNGYGYKGNKYFYKAINKYGWDNFEHIVLFDNLTKEEACLLEQCYIALYDTANPKYGYNNSLGGEHGLLSEQSRKKLSESKKGKQAGENNPFYGKHHTEEAKRKLSESHKGKHHTEESKKKMSEARRGENHPNYGKHHSEQTKRKISESHKGKPGMKGEKNPNYGKTGKQNPAARAVLMFTLDEEFIKKFDCIREAIQYLGKNINGSGSHISKCASGKQETAYGYKWKYEE